MPKEPVSPYRIDKNLLSSTYDDNAIQTLEHRLLKTEFADFDRKAIAAIWRQGREAVPDITPDEVLHIFLEKAQSLARSKTVGNKNGLLLWAWPSLLTPARIAQLRARLHLEKEISLGELNKYLTDLHRTLSDPDASEEEKRLVKQVLGMKESGH